METNEFGISKNLEAKIKMALENGPLDENDLAYFRNCAKDEGLSDVDLNFYINQLSKTIGKKQSESLADAQAQHIQEQRDAIGNECPKCHKQIPPMALECPYCKTKVVNKEGVSSAQKLLNQIEEINKDFQKTANSIDLIRRNKLSSEREQRINDLISMFPVPNTKEDIIEFLSLASAYIADKPKQKFTETVLGKILLSIITFGFYAIVLLNKATMSMMGASGNNTYQIQKERYKAWSTKYRQVLMKGRSITGDNDFQQQLDYYEKFLKK